MSDTYEPVKTTDHLGGHQRLYRFENGYGASVIRNYMSYGGSDGLWELAVIEWDGASYELTYETPIASDVIGYLSDAEVDEKLAEIKALERAS